MKVIDAINRRRMMMGGKHDPIVVWADHDKIAECIVSESYAAGLCASDQYMTLSEAALVQTIDTDGKVTKLYEKDKDYSYFQWFTHAEIVETYSYVVYGGFVVVPPVAIDTYQCGLRRFKDSKIVLLSRNPKPMFYSGYNGTSPNTNVMRFYELTNSSIYVPDDSYDGWQPYIDAAVNCPSWMSNTGITLHRISELTDEERAKIKIPY